MLFDTFNQEPKGLEDFHLISSKQNTHSFINYRKLIIFLLNYQILQLIIKLYRESYIRLLSIILEINFWNEHIRVKYNLKKHRIIT